jgi:hypothetical protein
LRVHTETKFITVAAGVLDEVEGSYYSIPATYSKIEDALGRFTELEKSGRHEAGVLIKVDGEIWEKLQEFGGDYMIARDPWGGFDLVCNRELGCAAG